MWIRPAVSDQQQLYIRVLVHRLPHRELRHRRQALIANRRPRLRMSEIAFDDRQRPLQLGQLRRFAPGDFIAFQHAPKDRQRGERQHGEQGDGQQHFHQRKTALRTAFHGSAL